MLFLLLLLSRFCGCQPAVTLWLCWAGLGLLGWLRWAGWLGWLGWLAVLGWLVLYSLPPRSTAQLAEPFGPTTSPPPNPLDKNRGFRLPQLFPGHLFQQQVLLWRPTTTITTTSTLQQVLFRRPCCNISPKTPPGPPRNHLRPERTRSVKSKVLTLREKTLPGTPKTPQDTPRTTSDPTKHGVSNARF